MEVACAPHTSASRTFVTAKAFTWSSGVPHPEKDIGLRIMSRFIIDPMFKL
jgi:hypothetical protein